jgi:hypothetical protein
MNTEPPRLQHAMRFTQRTDVVVDVLDRVEQRHEVLRAGLDRQRRAAGDLAVREAAALADGDRAFVGVDADRRAESCELGQHAADAATDVEDREAVLAREAVLEDAEVAAPPPDEPPMVTLEVQELLVRDAFHRGALRSGAFLRDDEHLVEQVHVQRRAPDQLQG